MNETLAERIQTAMEVREMTQTDFDSPRLHQRKHGMNWANTRF